MVIYEEGKFINKRIKRTKLYRETKFQIKAEWQRISWEPAKNKKEYEKFSRACRSQGLKVWFNGDSYAMGYVGTYSKEVAEYVQDLHEEYFCG